MITLLICNIQVYFEHWYDVETGEYKEYRMWDLKQSQFLSLAICYDCQLNLLWNYRDNQLYKRKNNRYLVYIQSFFVISTIKNVLICLSDIVLRLRYICYSQEITFPDWVTKYQNWSNIANTSAARIVLLIPTAIIAIIIIITTTTISTAQPELITIRKATNLLLLLSLEYMQIVLSLQNIWL